MSAKVAFLSQEIPPDLRNRRTVVQPGAVVERGGRRVVYVVRDDRAIETPVELGGELGEWVEIVKGVEPGTKVVAKPPPKLGDGDRITVTAPGS
jgi:multidrug efflux pump subunit AcrA (membrane-fusion protein)